MLILNCLASVAAYRYRQECLFQLCAPGTDVARLFEKWRGDSVPTCTTHYFFTILEAKVVSSQITPLASKDLIVTAYL